MLNQIQIQKLTKAMENYKNQTVVITSWFIKEGKFYRTQIMENVDILISDRIMCITDDNENEIEFSFDRIRDTYIDTIDVFTDGEPETHIIFTCFEEKFDFINLI